MKAAQWSDSRLISSIRAGAKSKEEALRYLIQAYPHYIRKIQRKLGLSQEQVLDAYTDGVMDLVAQVEASKFRGESKLSTYLYQIIYYKARDLLKKKTTHKVDYRETLPEGKGQQDHPDRSLMLQEKMQQLQHHLRALGEPCRQILLDWGYWGYSMEEIAQRNGLGSGEQAKKKKYKCLQQLRKQVPSYMAHKT
ncbi:MAG: sigma-70 family RNA polymerase sigma factor [Bacteroidota bacterium]